MNESMNCFAERRTDVNRWLKDFKLIVSLESKDKDLHRPAVPKQLEQS